MDVHGKVELDLTWHALDERFEGIAKRQLYLSRLWLPLDASGREPGGSGGYYM